jgi:hypothetical protein
MTSKLDLYQDLRVNDVDRRKAAVLVEVADPTGTRHRISFHFADADDAAAHAETIEQWQHRATRLTYVKGARHGALVDDAELLRRATDNDY